MSLSKDSKCSRVILGLMTFGPDVSTGARVTSLEDFEKCLDYFQAKGYNEVDTARSYVGGKQEAFTREAKWKDRNLILATKLYPSTPGTHTPELVKANLKKSLDELGTDQVDIFYLHAADRSIPFEDTLRACDELYREAKFQRLGLSNFTAFEVAEVVMICRQHSWIRPSIYQGMYNAITRNIESELIPACRRYGLEVVIYNPLAGGLFSGKIKTQADVPEEGRFSDTAISGIRYRERYFKDATFDALNLIENVAQKHGLTLLEIAFRWCVHHSALKIKDGNDGIIIGVSSLDQLKRNLVDIEKDPLPEEVVNALDEAWLLTKSTSAPYWHLNLQYTYDTKKSLFGDKS